MIGVLFCLFVAGCGGDSPQKLLKQANAAVERGELDEAIRYFERVDAEYPTSDEAFTARESLPFYRDMVRVESVYPHRRTRDIMISVARELLRHRDRNGRYPDALERLVPRRLPELPADAWGLPLRYEPSADRKRYRLTSLGADDQPGGSGEAGDLVIENGAFLRGG